MADYRLIVQMKGPSTGDRDVRLDDFLDFLFDLRTVLHATDRAIAHSDEPTTYYSVRDLSHSSPATVVLRAEKREIDLDLRDRVLTTFVGGVNEILSGAVPRGFGAGLLLDYQQLAKHLNGRLREASFEHRSVKAKVSASFGEKIAQIVGPDRREHGAVSGMLDIINVHQPRPFFWLYPAGGQERIRCFFTQELVAKVGQAIRRHVTVTGMLRFKAKMLQPHAVNARELEVHDADVDLPSLRGLRGIAPDAANGESSDVFVRRLRNAW
ncbi:MAG: hypothetical protein HYR72_02110 [Deltaproteobacteria bacterium]|nr:hypothetical protein [Deltaproteobacteria bacterium]MBI3387462.1 hypothetical protein [Deltaproteobacteria bacterium]